MKIGVFDSGIGGLSVAGAIKKAVPEHDIVFRNDALHVPYGSRSMDEVLTFVVPILQSMVADGVDCIVVACNTVSTNLIQPLRQLLPIPLIAMEPMVKPAAQKTKSKIITVCATPATLSSGRYAELKQEYAGDVTVLEPDCSDWARLIESSKLDHEAVAATITESLEQGSDVIVLGCTHYHWIEDEIKALADGRAEVIQAEQAVIAQLKRVLAQLA